MEIKFLKAGRGDSILLSSKGENMLVDGGDDSAHLFRELDEIYKNGQCLNYLIITHHDSDHIKGILDLFIEIKNGRFGDPKEFVKEVFFNSARNINGSMKTSNMLSYKQAYEVENYIAELGLNFHKLLIDTSEKIVLGELEIQCLSPNQEILDAYLEKTPSGYLSSYSSGDWKKSLEELSPFIDDQSLDTGLANLTSIVLLVKGKNTVGLLTGDITPKRFRILAEKLYQENSCKRVHLDFLKLPHHGSHRSITKDIISKFDCDKYVISTNGNNNFLPNKKTFLKVINYQAEKGKMLHFVFNYPELISELQFTDQEMSDYKFKIGKV